MISRDSKNVRRTTFDETLQREKKRESHSIRTAGRICRRLEHVAPCNQSDGGWRATTSAVHTCNSSRLQTASMSSPNLRLRPHPLEAKCCYSCHEAARTKRSFFGLVETQCGPLPGIRRNSEDRPTLRRHGPRLQVCRHCNITTILREVRDPSSSTGNVQVAMVCFNSSNTTGLKNVSLLYRPIVALLRHLLKHSFPLGKIMFCSPR